MIRWCSYCQRFIGEKAPYDDASISHGICEACAARWEDGEPLDADTEPLRALMGNLVESARAGDEAACERILHDPLVRSLGPESLLMGLLQPALYRAGREWQEGRLSVAAEHRLTSWCDRALHLVPCEPATAPFDLVIFQTPGNLHSLGPKVAARILAARGLSVEVFVPELPLDEMVAVARARRPRFIGLSCSLPGAVQVASDLVARMRSRLEQAFPCRYVLSGFAFRLGGDAPAPQLAPGVDVAMDLDYFFRS